MINGYERASREMVPAARILIARELKSKYNMTEAKIAQILGIAQAAVSKYLNGNYSQLVENTADKVDMDFIDKHIAQIASGNQKELKACICTVCGSMNRFDCKFSEAQEAAPKAASQV